MRNLLIDTNTASDDAVAIIMAPAEPSVKNRAAASCESTECQYVAGSSPVDFEWDSAKEQANRKKHGVDFQAAAKVFLDPHAIEFDDSDAAGSCVSMRLAWSTAECSLWLTR